eukprot:366443-Chlamydomonas_euryale.AAC.4
MHAGGGGMDESGSPKGPPWHSPLQMLRSRPDLSRMAALVDATPGLAGALDNDVLMATLLLPTNDVSRGCGRGFGQEGRALNNNVLMATLLLPTNDVGCCSSDVAVGMAVGVAKAVSLHNVAVTMCGTCGCDRIIV